MKDNIEDMVKETIEEKPLGGKSLSSIIKSNTFDKPSKGLSSLLSNKLGSPISETKTQIQQVTTEFYPSDMMINNEFLRIEREKNEKLTASLEKLTDLPTQLQTIQSKLEELTQFEEMNKLDQDINNELSKNIFDSLKEKRSYLYVVMGICIVFGLVLGKMSFTEEQPIAVAPTPVIKKELKKIVKLSKFVTLKFVNMRASNSPKSEIIKTISPNQILTKLDKKGGWINVEYTDLINNSTAKGWAWYENLKELK
ncbi:SH3 domain-containing protein [Halobacteriovorax sp.]|uniref:SH3 domain-containing protein n=1 Tax=Halobacteriovorax sp. TaxID=2020862 RepID=UPI00356589D7